MCTNLLCFFLNICTICSWYMFTPFKTSVMLWSCNILWLVINLLFCVVYVLHKFIKIWLVINLLFCLVYVIKMFIFIWLVIKLHFCVGCVVYMHGFIIDWILLIVVISTAVSISHKLIFCFLFLVVVVLICFVCSLQLDLYENLYCPHWQ